MQKKSLSKFFSIFLTVITLGLLGLTVWLTIFNGFQKAEDWWWLRSYVPASEIQQLAVDTDLSEEGTDLFYLSDPVLVNSGPTFDEVCKDKEEESIILGCYTPENKIYVYNVNDPRVSEVEEVTAAHEMLHAAYDRLGASEKTRIRELLNEQAKTVDDERIDNLLGLYRESIFDTEIRTKAQFDQYDSELHSIFGTELAELSPELEDYFKRYFNDRMVVVAMAQSYAQTFIDIGNKIEELDAKLAELDPILDSLQNSVDASAIEIDSREQSLLALLADGEVSEYNSQLPSFNSLIASHNDNVTELQDLVKEYNQIVNQHNEQAYIQRDLKTSINSSGIPTR